MTALLAPLARLRPTQSNKKGKTTRQVAVEAVAREARTTAQKAEAFVTWIERLVTEARQQGYGAHYLTPTELRVYHPILETIAPDKSVAVPGSAHAAVEAHVLDPAKGELGLLHDRAPDEVGEPTYCTVQMRLAVVRD